MVMALVFVVYELVTSKNILFQANELRENYINCIYACAAVSGVVAFAEVVVFVVVASAL